jgi:glycosyltransferase involved in cell wall biosynthesis
VNDKRLTFALPGDPGQRTGGYLYDRRLCEALHARGWAVEMLRLPDGFPEPGGAALEASGELLGRVPEHALLLVDGLALGAMPDLAARTGERTRLVGLVHHPLAYETGIARELAWQLAQSERAALAHAAHVIVTSTATRDTLIGDFGVPAERITVAMPGTDAAPLARGSNETRAVILAVGSVIPRKDFPTLVDTLSKLSALPWRLVIVGSLDRAPAEAARLRQAIERHHLQNRVVLEGELVGEALERAYDGADLLVSVSRYEGFGMALAEGLARGLPLVAVAGGAVGGWLPEDAALIVPPDDPDALEAALRAAVGDPTRREALRSGALAARDSLPTWEDTAEIVEKALIELAGR